MKNLSIFEPQIENTMLIKNTDSLMPLPQLLVGAQQTYAACKLNPDRKANAE